MKNSTHTLVIMAIKQALPSALIGIVDMLLLTSLSQKYAPNDDQSLKYDNRQSETSRLQVLTASMDGKAIKDGQGRVFKPDCALTDIDSCDGVLIPGFVPCDDGLPPQHIMNKTSQHWLKQQHDNGALLGASCSGSFVLGEANLLDRKRCTTTWWLHYELIKRFPHADAAWGSALIQDGNVITAGGPLSWIDISLRMIRVLAGIEAANRAADFAVVDTVPIAQNKYIPQGYLASIDPLLLEAEKKIRSNVSRPLRTVELASALAVSERTLHRRLKQLTGESPKSFIDRIRIDMVKTLLQDNNWKINRIAMELGYSDDAVFRRLFKKQVGMSPSDYRRWLRKRQTC